MKIEIATLRLDDIQEGDEFSFEEVITEKKIADFATLSGDYSTLHIHDEFAVNRGFRSRVAHGLLLASFLSRLVGMHFPGENALFLSINVKFPAPAYIGDKIRIKAKVDQTSPGTKVIVLKVSIENIITNEQLVKGKLHVGFTNGAIRNG